MKAVGALPTESRIQKMNDQQWLWYYLNILKDSEEDEKVWKTRFDYLGWFINPKLAKSVMGFENNIDNDDIDSDNIGDIQVIQGDQVINSNFEDELRNALSSGGISEDDFTELPSSTEIGNPNETEKQFLSKVLALRDQVENDENKNDENIEQIIKDVGLDIDDIDFFEYPDDE